MKSAPWMPLFLACLLCAQIEESAASVRYEAKVLPLPAGCATAWAVSINESQDVLVGACAGEVTRTFIYRAGNYIDVGMTPGAIGMAPTCIDDNGLVLGRASSDEGSSKINPEWENWGSGAPFSYDGALHSFLSIDGHDLSSILLTSPNGQIMSGLLFEPTFGQLAFIYADGHLTRLAEFPEAFFFPYAVNNKGVIAGVRSDFFSAYDYCTVQLCSNGLFRNVFSVTNQYASISAMTEQNDFVGTVEHKNRFGGFRYRAGKLSSLTGLPGKTSVVPMAINESNEIVGYVSTRWDNCGDSSGYTAVKWILGKAMRLSTLTRPRGMRLTSADGINNGGVIAASVEVDGASRPVILTPVSTKR